MMSNYFEPSAVSIDPSEKTKTCKNRKHVIGPRLALDMRVHLPLVGELANEWWDHDYKLAANDQVPPEAEHIIPRTYWVRDSDCVLRVCEKREW